MGRLFGQPAARQWTWLLLSAFPFIGAAWLYLKPLLLDQGMALEQVAWLVGIAGGTLGAFASLVGGRLIPLLGTARAIVLYLLAALLALGVLGLAVWLRLGQPWLIAGALLLALAMGAVSALMFGLTLFFSRQQRSASDYGLQSSLFVVTRLAAPVLAGLLLDRLGYGGLLASLGAGLALALVLAWRVRHSIARSTDALLRTPATPPQAPLPSPLRANHEATPLRHLPDQPRSGATGRRQRRARPAQPLAGA